jgi:hypothetical protein
MQIEMEEIYNCCTFLMERIEKEMNQLDNNFFETRNNDEKYKNYLFNEFKQIILNENDEIIEEEYLYIIKRIITIFIQLKQFQNVQFNLESKNEIQYIKFYKEIFNIINYITNLFPIEEYKFELKEIYPSYITHKRLQQLVPCDDRNSNKIKTIESPIQANEIIKMLRCFLLLILLRSFLFIYYNINEFIQTFLTDKFRHDKYIGLIAQQKLNLLYDIVHRPPIIKIFSNNWYVNQFKDKETYRFKKSLNIMDLLNFGLFLKEINENFIEINENYNLKYCLIYFFLLFTYDDFNFMESNENKNNYPRFISYVFKELLVEELFDTENIKKVYDTLSYKIMNFIHGNNYCTFYPLVYFEKFFVDELIKRIDSDKDLNFPKDPKQYYINRLKRYKNIKIIVESTKLKWEEKKILLLTIQEKLKINMEKYSKVNK